MMIKEYQVKQLFRRSGVPILNGQVAYTPEEARVAAEKIGGNAWIVKAQISANNRSQAHFADVEQEGLSGICWANTPQAVAAVTEQMLDHKLIVPNLPAPQEVKRVYVEEACLGQGEYRLSLRIDFMTQSLVLTVFDAGNNKGVYDLPDNKITAPILKRVMHQLKLKGEKAKEMQGLLRQLLALFFKYEAVAVEFDPIWETANGLVVLDGRIIFNDDSLFKLPEIARRAEPADGMEQYRLAKKNQFRYTKLNGNIACLVNGIGLSQATVDLIHKQGGHVGCLLDVGTEPSRDAVAKALKMALSDPDVDGVLVNIFGGMTRCDVIVNGLLSAAGEILAGLPVVIRMDGTNANIGRRLLFESRLPFTVVKGMNDAVREIIHQVKELA